MCLFPIKAWRGCDLDTGQYRVHFKPTEGAEPISLPCGKCVECLMQYSNEWALRCVMEASLHMSNCMLTLTYADAPNSVSKRDFQLFMKSLRKAISPVRIRFFGCGEYGSKGGRPHYHIIIFGWTPSDLVTFFRRDDHYVYKSKFVSDIWKRGFVTVEEVTFQSAKYCAKYLQKLNVVPADKVPCFTLMSNRPGLGLEAFKSYSADVDAIYYQGKSYSIPRYFRRKLQGDFTKQTEFRKRKADIYSTTIDARRARYLLKFGVLKR